MTTVAITCIGGAFSYETISQLRADPALPVKVIGVDGDVRTHNRHFVDAFHGVPLATRDPGGFVTAIREICARENVDVLIPCADEEVYAIAGEKDRFSPTVCAVEGPGTLARLRDKVALFDHLRDRGVPLPAYAAVDSVPDLEAAAARLGYPRVPFILKPRSGRGSRGIMLVDARSGVIEAREGERGLTSGPLAQIAGRLAQQGGALRLMAMEYLPGAVSDVDCVAVGGEPLCVVPRRRLWDDPFSRGVEGHEIVADAELEARTAEISRALTMNYAFDCDFGTAADGRPGLLEVNPRLSGSAAAALGGGVNMPLTLVRMALRLPVPSVHVKPGVRAYPVSRLEFSDPRS